MFRMCFRLISVSVIAVSLFFFGNPSCLGQAYAVIDVSSNGWIYSEAHGISGSGQVVGEYEAEGMISVSAFLYSEGLLSDLGHLSGAPYAVAYGIYGTNAVVGESDTANATHAFFYSNGRMTDLGTLGISNISGYSSAHAINGSGQIVGESSVSSSQPGTIHAVLYEGASKTDLGALGGNYSSATAINSLGDIAGESAVVMQGRTNVHAFKYTHGSMSDLGTLGGAYSSAKGINASGTIVGESEIVSQGLTNLHAFIYQNGSMSDLGTLGGSSSSASAVNSTGQVVGYATDTNEVSHAFLYDGTRMIDLNELIPPGSAFTKLSTADAINDAGQIAGSGYRSDGTYQAYLLTLMSPLSVMITNPADNATFQAPASFDVEAAVTDTAGVVTNVEFLLNGAVIGNAASTPYAANATNLTAGSYQLTAIAFDSTGLMASNSITVIVSSVADVPPTIAITNPAANATFVAPATVAIDASASDSDGSITNVQFLINETVLTNIAASPYSTIVNGVGPGTYILTAVAFDNGGLTATNSISVTVSPADVPPDVAITNPAPNSIFAAPATFSVAATASDSDGSVTNVQFLVNGLIIGNIAAAPYSAIASNLNVGAYVLTAIAFDNAGMTATNTINITVSSGTTLPVTLTQPAFANGSFSFSFPTQVGVTYQAQFTDALGSTNAWNTFTNLSGTGSPTRVTDTAAVPLTRFYRVVSP